MAAMTETHAPTGGCAQTGEEYEGPAPRPFRGALTSTERDQ